MACFYCYLQVCLSLHCSQLNNYGKDSPFCGSTLGAEGLQGLAGGGGSNEAKTFPEDRTILGAKTDHQYLHPYSAAGQRTGTATVLSQLNTLVEIGP